MRCAVPHPAVKLSVHVAVMEDEFPVRPVFAPLPLVPLVPAVHGPEAVVLLREPASGRIFGAIHVSLARAHGL